MDDLQVRGGGGWWSGPSPLPQVHRLPVGPARLPGTCLLAINITLTFSHRTFIRICLNRKSPLHPPSPLPSTPPPTPTLPTPPPLQATDLLSFAFTSLSSSSRRSHLPLLLQVPPCKPRSQRPAHNVFGLKNLRRSVVGDQASLY